MSDGACGFKTTAADATPSKQGNAPAAQNTTSLKRTAGWLPSPFRAVAIKIAHSQSGIFAHLRDVLGRRRANATNRDEY